MTRGVNKLAVSAAADLIVHVLFPWVKCRAPSDWPIIGSAFNSENVMGLEETRKV